MEILQSVYPIYLALTLPLFLWGQYVAHLFRCWTNYFLYRSHRYSGDSKPILSFPVENVIWLAVLEIASSTFPLKLLGRDFKKMKLHNTVNWDSLSTYCQNMRGISINYKAKESGLNIQSVWCY